MRSLVTRYANSALVRGVSWLAAAQVIFVVTGYATHFLLGRILGPERYGIYSVVLTIITAITLALSAGIPRAVSKFVAESPEKSPPARRTGFIVQASISIIVAALFYIAASLIASFLNDPSLTLYLQIATLGIIPSGIQSFFVFLANGLGDFGRQGLISALYSLCKLGLIVALAHFRGVEGALWGFMLASLVGMLLAGWIQPVGGKGHFPLRKLLSFSFPLLAYAVSLRLFRGIDLLLLKALTDDAVAVGYYAAAVNIASVVFVLSDSLANVLYPSVSELNGLGAPRSSLQGVSEALRMGMFLLATIALVLGLGAPLWLKILYSAKFIEAAAPLRILVIGSFLAALHSAMSNILAGKGRPQIAALVTGLGLTLSLALNLVLIPRGGMMGAAWASTISAFFMTLLSTVVASRLLSRQDQPQVGKWWRKVG